MKKSLQILGLLCITALSAQAPEKFSYQAVVRNASNALVTTAPVGMKISILKNSAFGTVVYSETQTVNTNANGLVSLQIGAGSVLSGTISGINWSNDSYYIKTETDPAGGTNYSIAGTSQLLSVPYAMFAKSSGSGGASFTLPYAGTSSADNVNAFKITNTSSTNKEAGFFENTGSTNQSAALTGQSKSTSIYATGVQGFANSNTTDGALGAIAAAVRGDLLGTDVYGSGVYGTASNGKGIYGTTIGGTGVYGASKSDLAVAGSFQANSLSSRALSTYGKLSFSGISEGAGKVLTSDAAGNATWQDNTPFVHFSSFGGTTQIIPKNITTTINSWTGLEESGGANYNPTTGEYTIPITGYYSISAHVSFGTLNDTTGLPASVAISAGTTNKEGYSNNPIPSEYYSDPVVTLEKKLNVGDKVKVKVFQSGATNNSLDSAGSSFSINLLHK